MGVIKNRDNFNKKTDNSQKRQKNGKDSYSYGNRRKSSFFRDLTQPDFEEEYMGLIRRRYILPIITSGIKSIDELGIDWIYDAFGYMDFMILFETEDVFRLIMLFFDLIERSTKYPIEVLVDWQERLLRMVEEYYKYDPECKLALIVLEQLYGRLGMYELQREVDYKLKNFDKILEEIEYRSKRDGWSIFTK